MDKRKQSTPDHADTEVLDNESLEAEIVDHEATAVLGERYRQEIEAAPHKWEEWLSAAAAPGRTQL